MSSLEKSLELTSSEMKEMVNLPHHTTRFIKAYGVTYAVPYYTCEEFLTHVSLNPSDYIQYCEVLILPNGDVLKVIPSHGAVLGYLATYKTGYQEEDFPFSWYTEACLYVSRAVSVWYGFQKVFDKSLMTVEQWNTYRALVGVGLIKENLDEVGPVTRTHFLKELWGDGNKEGKS